jgi:hypothetical protein
MWVMKIAGRGYFCCEDSFRQVNVHFASGLLHAESEEISSLFVGLFDFFGNK